jgi:cytochrome P450
MRTFTECEEAAFWQDPATTFLPLFEHGERVLAAPGGGLCVFGRAELVALARCTAVDGVPVPVPEDAAREPVAALHSGGLFAIAGPRHRALRRAALRGLGVAAIAEARSQIAVAVKEAVAAVPAHITVDLAQDLVLPLTAQIWAALVGYGDGDRAAIAQAVGVLSNPKAPSDEQAAAARAITGRTQALRASGGSPFLANIADALPPDEDVAALVASMAIDGIDRAAAGLAGALAVLLVAERDGLAPGCFEPRFEEALRLAMPVILSMRLASADVEVAGVPVPAGTLLWMWWGAGCVDPEAYAEPRSFRPERAGPLAPVFGGGAHVCLGHALVRETARALLPACAARGLVALSPPAPPEAWRLARLPRIAVRFER